MQKLVVIKRTAEHIPDVALPVDFEFAGVYADVTCEGALVAARSKVCVVGLARNIGGLLPASLHLVANTVRHFADWKALVFENDSTDDTKEILQKWATENPENVVVQLVNNGRPHLHGFEPERVAALADYRNRCRDMVREHMPDADFVIVLDLDAWGGWSIHGIINGIGWHAAMPQAGCMASTSLFKQAGNMIEGKNPWCHYDNWAYRWLGWSNRLGPWFTFWLPPPGAPPIDVCSAFGGLAIYKTKPYLEAEYSGDNGDCEHVNFHRMMKDKGWTVHLNPAQRCVMTWLAEAEESSDGGGQHSDDQR